MGRRESIAKRLGGQGRFLLAFIGLLWVIEILNTSLGHRLCSLGIVPRVPMGLRGIPLCPFLHGGAAHLTANTFGILILGGLVVLQGKATFLTVSVGVALFGGLGTWVFGRPAVHVGASGLVFGYFGYVVGRGWYERSLKSILPAALAIFLYGGAIWGVLPTQPGVSWESHLFGLIAGVLCAKDLSRKKR